MTVVLDASALLAHIKAEKGQKTVAAVMSQAVISTVNLTEVVQKLHAVDADVDGVLQRVRKQSEETRTGYLSLHGQRCCCHSKIMESNEAVRPFFGRSCLPEFGNAARSACFDSRSGVEGHRLACGRAADSVASVDRS